MVEIYLRVRFLVARTRSKLSLKDWSKQAIQFVYNICHDPAVETWSQRKTKSNASFNPYFWYINMQLCKWSR